LPYSVQLLHVFFLENQGAIKSEQEELKTVELPISIIVDFRQGRFQIVKSDHLFLTVAEFRVVSPLREDTHVVDCLAHFIEGDAPVRPTLDIKRAKIVVNLLQTLIDDTILVKCAQNVTFVLAHRHDALVVALDLAGEVVAHFPRLRELPLPFLLVLDDPRVRKELFGGGTFLRVVLKAPDEEVTLVIIENALILHAVHNALGVKVATFARL